jgi:hypothetical protein
VECNDDQPIFDILAHRRNELDTFGLTLLMDGGELLECFWFDHYKVLVFFCLFIIIW